MFHSIRFILCLFILCVLGSGKLKQFVPGLQSVIAAVSKATADVKLVDGDTVTVGTRTVTALSTPGHTEVQKHCCCHLVCSLHT